MTKSWKILINALDDLKEKKGISSRDIAEKSGIAEQTISRYRTGVSEPSLTNIDRIAQALDMTISQLLADPLTSPRSHTIVDCLIELSRLFQGLQEDKVPPAHIHQLKTFAENAVRVLQQADRSRGGSKDNPKE